MGIGKNGCKPKLVGIDFIENTVINIVVSGPKIDLKILPGNSVLLSRIQTKSYPYKKVFKTVSLEQSLPLAPKSSRVISLRPPSEIFRFRKGISFVIGSKLQVNGIYTYNVQCFRQEKELPIMLNNLQNCKVTIEKGPIGCTLEDIEIKQEPELGSGSCFILCSGLIEIKQEPGCW